MCNGSSFESLDSQWWFFYNFSIWHRLTHQNEHMEPNPPFRNPVIWSRYDLVNFSNNDKKFYTWRYLTIYIIQDRPYLVQYLKIFEYIVKPVEMTIVTRLILLLFWIDLVMYLFFVMDIFIKYVKTIYWTKGSECHLNDDFCKIILFSIQ